MKKKITFITVLLALAFLAACSQESEPSQPKSTGNGNGEQNESQGEAPSDISPETSSTPLKRQLENAGYAEDEDDRFEGNHLRSPDKRIAVSLPDDPDDGTVSGVEYFPNFIAQPGQTFNETIATHPEYENESLNVDLYEISDQNVSLETIIAILDQAYEAMQEYAEANPREGYVIAAIELDIGGETFTFWCDYLEDINR